MRLNKNSLDTVQIFLVYVSFVGDVERAAAALHLDPEVVRTLAEKEGWPAKIAKICLMSKSGKPGDFERATSRALSFVQAHQLRRIIDGILAQLGALSPEELVESLRVTTKGGTYMSARFLADLASTMEKAHSLASNALGDTIGERLSREDGDNEEMNVSQLHLAVMQALSHPKVRAINIAAELKEDTEFKVKQITDAPPEAPTDSTVT